MTSLNLRFLVVLLISILTVAVLVALGVASLVVQSHSQERQTVHNATMLRVILALSDCTPEDTPEGCRQRQADRAKAEGVARVEQVDCRTRRAVAGLPAIAPNERCTP